MEQLDNNLMYGNFILGEWDHNIKSVQEACRKCELCDMCDRLSDDLNRIEYCICRDAIKDKTYKDIHFKSYFINSKDND